MKYIWAGNDTYTPTHRFENGYYLAYATSDEWRRLQPTKYWAIIKETGTDEEEITHGEIIDLQWKTRYTWREWIKTHKEKYGKKTKVE